MLVHSLWNSAEIGIGIAMGAGLFALIVLAAG
jgi:hypothetical protein